MAGPSGRGPLWIATHKEGPDVSHIVDIQLSFFFFAGSAFFFFLPFVTDVF